MEIHEIVFADVKLEIEGKYYKGSPRTRDYPGDPQEFEIHKIMIQDTDVTNLLCNDIEELERIILEKNYS